ncbi:MAG TPA: FxsA family protein [Acidimicrobiales bacterium]|nr:FxsA family protein [Acidimicrobiales bacterium]
MAVLLALLFLVVPLVELAIIIQVGAAIGTLNTIALLLFMSVAGGWLMKREGLGVVRRVQGQVQAGQVPGSALVDGFLVLLGGALMLTPGFLTDAIGLSLLLPPVRAVVRRVAAGRIRVVALGNRRGEGTGGPGGVIDV